MAPSPILRCCAIIAVGVALSLAAGTDYGAMSASQKLEYLWRNVVSDTHSGSFMNAIQTLFVVASSAYRWSMTSLHADWREAGHHKATHGVGAVAKAHFVWKVNNYTGMFQKADNCIIRMANPALPGGLAASSYAPSLGVKCLRDGAESANMEFIWQVDGYAVMPKGVQKSCSYFEAPLSNHIPVRDDIAMPLKSTFIKDFQDTDPRSFLLGLSQMGSGPQNGNAGDIKAPYVPFALVLKPAKGLNEVDCSFGEPLSQLLNLEHAGVGVPGKTLYEVYAVRDPSKSWQQPAAVEHIGSLVLDSSFTSSAYGDSQLFFRHVFFKEEFGIVSANEPERAAKWEEYVKSEENYKHEGANIYWPLLPGGLEEIAQISSRQQGGGPEQMLQSDITMV